MTQYIEDLNHNETIKVELRYYFTVRGFEKRHTAVTKPVYIKYTRKAKETDYNIAIDPDTCQNNENLWIRSNSDFSNQIASVSWVINNDKFNLIKNNSRTAKLTETNQYDPDGNNTTTITATINLRTGGTIIRTTTTDIKLDNTTEDMAWNLAWFPSENVVSNLTVVPFDLDDTEDDHIYWANGNEIGRYTWGVDDRNRAMWIMKKLETPGKTKWKWTGEQNSILATAKGTDIWVHYIDQQEILRLAKYNASGDLIGQSIISRPGEKIDRIALGTDYVVGLNLDTNTYNFYKEHNNGSNDYIFSSSIDTNISNGHTAIMTINIADENLIFITAGGNISAYKFNSSSGSILPSATYSPSSGIKGYARLDYLELGNNIYKIYFQDNAGPKLKMIDYNLNTNTFSGIKNVELGHKGIFTRVSDFAINKKDGTIYYRSIEDEFLYRSWDIDENLSNGVTYKQNSSKKIIKSGGFQFNYTFPHLYYVENVSDKRRIYNTWFEDGCNLIKEATARRAAGLAQKVQKSQNKNTFSNTENLVIKLYPNPTNGLFTIDIGQNPEHKTMVQVYSINGTLVYDEIFEKTAGSALKINLEEQPKGLYIVQLTHNNEVTTHKLMKK